MSLGERYCTAAQQPGLRLSLVFNKDGSLFEPGFARTNRTARATLRLDGYVSLDAGDSGGELLTGPLTFTGTTLLVNLRAARGNLRAELTDAAGQPIPGFRAADCLPLEGDGVSLPIRWRGSSDLGSLAGKPIRLRFVVMNCSVYSFQFRA